jgi:hypothetical protein
VTVVRRLGFVVALSILTGGALLPLQRVTRSQSASARSVAATDRVLPTDARNARDDHDDLDVPNGFVDLYGNEVTDAIATYTFDQAGSLYELHSPQTELPRLGMPKS